MKTINYIGQKLPQENAKRQRWCVGSFAAAAAAAAAMV